MEEKKVFGLKRVFHKSQISLEHSDPNRFVKGPWHPGIGPTVRVPFLIYRILMAFLYVGVLLWSAIYHWGGGKWLIFATHWSFVMCTVQALLGCFIVVREYIKHKSRKSTNSDEESSAPSRAMPLLHKLYWLTFNMSMPVTFSITVIYWGVIYPNGGRVHEGPPSAALNVMMHIVNSVLGLVEVFFGGPPSRPAHALHTFLFGISYTSFNFIYWVFGGSGPFDLPYIYKVMDWGNKPLLASMMSIINNLMLVFFHFVICGLAAIRSKLSKYLYWRQEIFTTIQLPEIRNGKPNSGCVL